MAPELLTSSRPMQQKIIGCIGGGNMATSLIGGLLADGADSTQIWVADPDEGRLSHLQEHFAINTCTDNHLLLGQVDVVLFAVKPQVLRTVCLDSASLIQQRAPLVISVAAGIRLHDIERWLGGTVAVVRTMPNTPALVRCGATALVANDKVTTAQRELAESVMRAVGLTLWLDDEQQMDTVTALSGSGPAYFFLIMEALQQAALELGLPADSARLLTLQTAFGASRMALESSEEIATLRRQVTSPGGTTERALEVFEKGDIRDLIRRALRAAQSRSHEIATQLGSD